MNDNELKQLPEQETGSEIWFISSEFRQLIESLPFYSGVLREDGRTVSLGFVRDQGYNPEIPLAAYFKGEIYAKLLEKARPLYMPDDGQLAARVHQRWIDVTSKISNETGRFSGRPYRGSSEDLLKRLDKEDGKQ